jgi:F-type H+-transporting ATPase subunit delta
MKTTRQIKRDARELWRVCMTDGVLDEARARQVIDEIARSRHTGAVAVLKQFGRLLRLDAAARTAIVASATPLDATVRAEVERGLDRLHGRPIATEFVVDPSLIGGMRVQIGSDVYDGTIRAGLNELESRF